MHREPAGDDRPDGVEPVLEGRDDAKAAATAAQSPEQIRVVLGACPEDAPVRGDHLRGEKVVRREAVLRHRPAEPAAERQPGDPRRRDDAPCYGEPVELRGRHELTPRHASLGACRPPRGVDEDAAHGREVDHDSAVADGLAGDVVAAATDRDLELPLVGERERPHDVGDPVAPRDHGRTLVHERVVDASGVLVPRVSGEQQRPEKSSRAPSPPRR